MSIKVLTYNIHKGFNWNNSKLTLEMLKSNLAHVHPDIVFLQEVVGENKKHERKIKNWISNQFEFLADGLWSEYAYSKHATYDFKDHGNVILSKYPIIEQNVYDISQNKYEQRAILHAKLLVDQKEVDCFCVHLNLLGKDRVKQYQQIKEIIQNLTVHLSPIIIAGDFNDWNKSASKRLLGIKGLQDAHKQLHSQYAKTFPAPFALLSLDRIYTRGMNIKSAQTLNTSMWRSISDHLPIIIEAEL